MDVAVTRSWAADRGTWLRAPSRIFILSTTVSFSHEERWAIDAHNLYHHVIFDRTPPNLIDISVKTVMETIAGSPIMSIVLLLFAAFGVMVLINHFRQPPRFDPTLHMERPPIEHQPQRPLPSADAFADWATGRERQPEHRGIPWQE